MTWFGSGGLVPNGSVAKTGAVARNRVPAKTDRCKLDFNGENILLILPSVNKPNEFKYSLPQV
ncbi:hypothetical protein CCP3SC1AL1_100002 [Gammaproteobacteria bacterium]